MEIQDRIMEWLLATLDHFIDQITRGAWTKNRGQVIPNVKVKEQ